MKRALQLAIALSLGGCKLGDNGAGCPLDGADYVGLIALSRINFPGARVVGQPETSFDAEAVYFRANDAGALQQLFVDCDPGGCCYIPAPADAGTGSLNPTLSAWNVSVTDETEPDAGTGFGDYLTDGGVEAIQTGVGLWGSLTYGPWQGGDELRVQGRGSGTVDAFSQGISTPLDFRGLNPGLFADAGVIPLGANLALTWTPGGTSSVLIGVFDETTLGQVVCPVSDNGSFEIPSSVLSNFQPGDRGALAIGRSAQDCASSGNASISVIAQTETVVEVVFR